MSLFSILNHPCFLFFSSVLSEPVPGSWSISGDDRKKADHTLSFSLADPARRPLAFSIISADNLEQASVFLSYQTITLGFLQFKGENNSKCRFWAPLRLPLSTYIEVALNKSIKETGFAAFAISYNWQLVPFSSLACVFQTSLSICINNQLVTSMFTLFNSQTFYISD